MKGYVISGLLLAAIMAGAGAGYFLGGQVNGRTTTSTLSLTTVSNLTTTVTIQYQVINPNVTVRGQAASIPLCALRVPACSNSPNATTPAVLIKYNGTYYYLSYQGLTNATNPSDRNTIWYTVWYDNSTAFCISPKVEWSISCPA